jgi:putative transposase
VGRQHRRRKGQSGAFWTDRCHLTMVETGVHLWRCLLYIELNMVRAGVVDHPAEWLWCSYAELRGGRQRRRLLDTDALLRAVGAECLEDFLRQQDHDVREALAVGALERQPYWTESVAVGSERYVQEMASRVEGRQTLSLEPVASVGGESVWMVREAGSVYDFCPGKRG